MAAAARDEHLPGGNGATVRRRREGYGCPVQAQGCTIELSPWPNRIFLIGRPIFDDGTASTHSDRRSSQVGREEALVTFGEDGEDMSSPEGDVNGF